MMARPMWPNAAYLRRLTIVYALAAVLAGFVTFVVIAFVYDPRMSIFSLGAFLAGVICGAFSAYAAKRGLLNRAIEWAYDVVRHPARLMTP